jgi:hypothetical protein
VLEKVLARPHFSGSRGGKLKRRLVVLRIGGNTALKEAERKWNLN